MQKREESACTSQICRWTEQIRTTMKPRCWKWKTGEGHEQQKTVVSVTAAGQRLEEQKAVTSSREVESKCMSPTFTLQSLAGIKTRAEGDSVQAGHRHINRATYKQGSTSNRSHNWK